MERHSHFIGGSRIGRPSSTIRMKQLAFGLSLLSRMKPATQSPRGRVCACGAILSMYNPSYQCSVCEREHR